MITDDYKGGNASPVYDDYSAGFCKGMHHVQMMKI